MKAKDFDNVVHRSLLEILGSALIIDVITQMELHLILGIVNYLFQQLQSIWPQSKEVAKRLHIQEQSYHGCHFVGNDCHKIPSLSLKEYTLCFTMPNILSEEKKPLWDSTVSKQLRLCIKISNITGKDINRIHFTQITVNSFIKLLLTTIVNISEGLPEENNCH